MSIYNIGRICVKLAGRDAGKKCVVLSEEKEGKVLIDGATRRREVNIKHLEPINETVSIEAGSDTSAVASALKEFGVEVRETKAKKSTGNRPKRMKKVKKGGKAKAKVQSATNVKEAKVEAKDEAKVAVAAKETKAPVETKESTESKKPVEVKTPAKSVEDIFLKKK
jgi:large subunit ribosomal protein L14e